MNSNSIYTSDHDLTRINSKHENMLMLTTFCAIVLAQSAGLNLIDLPDIEDEDMDKRNIKETSSSKPYPPIRTSTDDVRRHWLANQSTGHKPRAQPTGLYDDEKDANIKTKISTLVQQTIHDTERRIRSIQYLKERYRERPPYRVGFILSMVKKTRDVLNELFNVAVKHRDEWKALEQLKIFELIVHTNVDTTHLVRQLVEIHIQHLNTTNSNSRKVVLL